MRKAIISLVALGFLLATHGAFAQTNLAGQDELRTLTTAVPFLMVGPDSRYGALGEAGVAIADDANATHWNASGLAFTDQRMGFSMSYSPWLRALNIPDINLMYLSGYYNTGNSGVIGASLRYFSLGEIQFTNEDGDFTGTDKPNEFALDVAYALKISEVFSAAISLRYFNSRLTSAGGVSANNQAVNSAAGDISFLYKKDFKIRGAEDIPVQFSSGLNISNIGPKVSYSSASQERDFIPTNLRIGYAFKFFLDEYNSLTFANDFNKLLIPSEGGGSELPLLDGIFGSFSDAEGGFTEELAEVNMSFGLEYWYQELFAARLGFFYEDPTKGNRKFITLGAGIKYNVFGLHFAFLAPIQQNHPLQNTLRFTLTYDFESIDNE